MKKLRHFLFLVATVGGAAALSLIGGIGLEAVSDELTVLIPLLVSVPSLNNLAGDYAAISGSHAADPEETSTEWRDVRRAVNWALLINVIGIVAIACVIAALRGYQLSLGFIGLFTLFVAGSVWLVVCGLFWLNKTLDRFLESHRFNADDLLIPIGTALADIAMLGLISLAVITIF